jgi:hypothetical protein
MTLTPHPVPQLLDPWLLELLPPPQATTNRLVAMSSPTPAANLPTRIVWGGRAFIIAFPFDSASGP